MELTVTATQFRAVRNIMGAQAIVLYVRDTDGFRISQIALLDPKLGGTTFSWGTEADQPLVTVFLAENPNAIEVGSIV